MEIRTAAPRIPDHEVLRCIGKGSYGEVWLARAVTGTLRAVKVVRREDFELDRTFEREFEGIMKFEPVSREHPGLVHVLHVGRNDEEGFYYYVMELGDDRERGSRVDATDYEPRTMGTDRTMKHRLPIAECIEHGAQVAEGLAHLHECGLTHRDIKPSNIIFVNGKAKLADIGLVAAAGQMTFVGTEGFVPPEGPGTKLADIYSLGMVLYELSTGKDRLQFPELPDDPGEARNRPQRQSLNDIILKACALQPKKRFSSARDMALALRAASRKKEGRAPWMRRLVTFPLVTAAAAFAIVTWQHNGAMPWPPGRFAGKDGIAPPPPGREGRVRIESVPPSASVFYNDQMMGRTPLTVTVPAGEANFTLRRNKYQDKILTVTGIQAGTEITTDPVVLRFDNPPKPGQPWENSLGMIFEPVPEGHLSRRAVEFTQLTSVQEFTAGGVVKEDVVPNQLLHMVKVPKADAIRFCEELTRRETEAGWLTDDLCYRPEIYLPKDPKEAQKLKAGEICFRLMVEKFGRISVDSDPPGADIYENGKMVGTTQWESDRHRTGELEFRLTLPGYKEAILTGQLKSGAVLALNKRLEKSQLAVFGKEWQNSLGIPFHPIGPDVLVAAWETRVQDFAAYAKATGSRMPLSAAGKDGKDDPNQQADHPVVNITRAEARQFCEWLTRTEQAADYLDQTMVYRLPTDAEWSLAAKSPNLDGANNTPEKRHLVVTGVYPWFPYFEFPPHAASNSTKAAGNFGDLTALRNNALGTLKPWQIKALETLKYHDGTVFTAPVGQFAPNVAPDKTGLFDMAGNVWEFVEDDYGDATTPERAHFAVLRGGSWKTPASDPDELATQFRLAVPPDKSDNSFGFRMVLASLAPPAPPVPPASSATIPDPETTPD